jgi:hypothetical protein
LVVIAYSKFYPVIPLEELRKEQKSSFRIVGILAKIP